MYIGKIFGVAGCPVYFAEIIVIAIFTSTDRLDQDSQDSFLTFHCIYVCISSIKQSCLM